MGSNANQRDRSAALVLAFLVGLGVGECCLDWRGRTRSTALPPAPAHDALVRPLPEPLPHPRQLRQARGVGRRRSIDVSRFLWRQGPEADIETLAGVGPRTASAVSTVLARGR